MKSLSSIPVLLIFVLSVAFSSGQDENDARSINPDVCGLTSKKAALVLQREERSTTRSPQVTINQREHGWQVLTMLKNNIFGCGTLINSRWVLSIALKSE
jgi:hypothetical protein